jgi:Ca2+-binding EF-hand superfamily protein
MLSLCGLVLAGGRAAAADEPKKDADKADRPVDAVVVAVNAVDHKVTVKLQDADGKEIEKTFTLEDAARLLDDAGKAVRLDDLKSGDEITVLLKAGKLAELRRRARKEAKALFDVDRFFEDYDVNKDGFLQREELPERLRKNFDDIDVNKDGKISKEELAKGFHLLAPRRRPSDVMRVLIEMSDCDECCAEELQAAYDMLRKMDKNNDGKIDAEELKAAREQVIEDRVDALIKELDADKDGKISKAEARGALRRNFDKLDLNKDGFIDRAELLKAAREREAAPEDKDKVKDESGKTEKEPAKKKPGEGP